MYVLSWRRGVEIITYGSGKYVFLINDLPIFKCIVDDDYYST
jgi:hypothetical protein